MKVSRLISLLESFPEDWEVRLMTQQEYPFEHAIAGVANGAQIEDKDLDADEDDEYVAGTTREGYVFITEGDQLAYGQRDAWEGAER